MDSHQNGGAITHPEGQSNQSEINQKINNIMAKYDGILSDTDKADLIVLSKQQGSSELLQSVNEATGRDYKTFEDAVKSVNELTKFVGANKKIKDYFDSNPQLRVHIAEDGDVTVGQNVDAATGTQAAQTTNPGNPQNEQGVQNNVISDPELEAYKAAQREEFWKDPNMASIKEDLLKESTLTGEPFMVIYNNKKAVYDELAAFRVQKTQDGESDPNSNKEDEQQKEEDFIGLNS